MGKNKLTRKEIEEIPAAPSEQPEDKKSKVLGIGGGTGLSTLFRGLRNKDLDISGIISVTDDGGSSGRLREGFGILPPGDFRNCLVALSDTEPILQKLFQHRFEGNDPLSGHSFGNLFILAMEEITGSFEEALEESCKILNVKGQLIPSTLDQINLSAEMKDGSTINGESNIQKNYSGIKKLNLNPLPNKERGLEGGWSWTPFANQKAIEEIMIADYIVIGPGSLYTSIIPNFLVPEIAHFVEISSAKKIYVCNIATQLGETTDFDACDHVQTLLDYCNNASSRLINTDPNVRAINLLKEEDYFTKRAVSFNLDYIIVNNNIGNLGKGFPTSKCVEIGNLKEEWGEIILEDLMNTDFKGHHDSDKLANVIMDIINK